VAVAEVEASPLMSPARQVLLRELEALHARHRLAADHCRSSTGPSTPNRVRD
jgi:hypothetical protein